MVDAKGCEVWCPWVPSCDLSAITSLGQSSSWSFPSFLGESTGISTGVYDPYEYLPPSPLLPTSPTRAASGGHHSDYRPHSPDPAKTAEVSPLASLAARFCTPAPSAVSKALGHASPATTAPGSPPNSSRPSSAAAVTSLEDSRHELLLKAEHACLNHSSSQAVLPSSVAHVGEDRMNGIHQQSPCTAGHPPVAAQNIIPAAPHAHVYLDPGQAPDHDERQPLSGGDRKQNQASDAEASKDEHWSAPLQQQQPQEVSASRCRKGKGPLAAIASSLVEEDSDDADLLMDLSWANVKPRGSW